MVNKVSFVGITSIVISAKMIFGEMILQSFIFLAFVSVILASSEWLDTILLEKAAQIKNQISD